MKFLSKPKKETNIKTVGVGTGKTVRVLKQIGRSNETWDEPRKALPPGKRVSKTGKTYWETRKNRSDKIGRKV